VPAAGNLIIPSKAAPPRAIIARIAWLCRRKPGSF
jgi:hypothetical protein